MERTKHRTDVPSIETQVKQDDRAETPPVHVLPRRLLISVLRQGVSGLHDLAEHIQPALPIVSKTRPTSERSNTLVFT